MCLDMMPVAFCVHFLYLKDSETLIMGLLGFLSLAFYKY